MHRVQEKLLELYGLGKIMTVRQLKDELKLSSTSVVSHHINALKKKGYIINFQKAKPVKEKTIDEIIDDALQRFVHDAADHLVYKGSPKKFDMTWSGYRFLRVEMESCYEKGFNDSKRKKRQK